MKKRAIIFFDANNWYHNLKKWVRPAEIDLKKIVDLITVDKDLDIKEIRWYASVPNIEKQGIKIITRKLQRLSNKEIKKKRQDLLDSWDLCKVCKPLVEAGISD